MVATSPFRSSLLALLLLVGMALPCTADFGSSYTADPPSEPAAPADAGEKAATTSPGGEASSVANNSGMQREYARLAQLLNSEDRSGRNEAASTLLKVRPSDVPNADTRKLIARGY